MRQNNQLVSVYGSCLLSMSIFSISACQESNSGNSTLRAFSDASVTIDGKQIKVQIEEKPDRGEYSCSTSLIVKVKATDLGAATQLVTAPYGNGTGDNGAAMSIYKHKNTTKEENDDYELKENKTISAGETPYVISIDPTSTIETKIYTNQFPSSSEIYSADISSFDVNLIEDKPMDSPILKSTANRIKMFFDNGIQKDYFYIHEGTEYNTPCLAKIGSQAYVEQGLGVLFDYPNWDRRCILFKSEATQVGKFLEIMKEVKRQILIPRHQNLCAGFTRNQL